MAWVGVGKGSTHGSRGVGACKGNNEGRERRQGVQGDAHKGRVGECWGQLVGGMQGQRSERSVDVIGGWWGERLLPTRQAQFLVDCLLDARRQHHAFRPPLPPPDCEPRGDSVPTLPSSASVDPYAAALMGVSASLSCALSAPSVRSPPATGDAGVLTPRAAAREDALLVAGASPPPPLPPRAVAAVDADAAPLRRLSVKGVPPGLAPALTPAPPLPAITPLAARVRSNMSLQQKQGVATDAVGGVEGA